ncbi:Sterile alpha and TIR motif-containing protein variant 2 [Trichostrongylus colubriformis]|uniref:ADP-ribosyl cyclase/cyclic ADP-ribose hydrolase n=1 Tax=Trichostrongylus colubriformis TaxID=6319 RepID=A0AAN8FRN1_TRICO
MNGGGVGNCSPPVDPFQTQSTMLSQQTYDPPSPMDDDVDKPSTFSTPAPTLARPTSFTNLQSLSGGFRHIKPAIVARPSVVVREKSVAINRFKKSRTRRFFHPYAKEIGAIQALKEVASSPDEVAAKFASEALTVIGEEVPYKLAQQVPNWTVKDVQYWVKKIGFEDYVDHFAKQMVDGDILLHLNEKELERDIGMSSGLHRKRFMRELESLKIAADYSAVDESNLDQLLMSLSPELSVYTYKMLSCGINRSLLGSLTDELMQTACGITNPIHRLKMTQAFQNAKHPDEVEVAVLSKQIDVFISYRRSTGNQLASLIKVLLQLKGYKVFIDVDKLYAGKFDSSLLKNIQAAKHFILVLTPNSLDRLLNDHNGDDWIHKELKCAFEYQKNIIPIFDQAFEFPQNEEQIPQDIRMITKYNGVKWVHDYQDACMGKVVRFIEGELNRTPSLPAPTHTTSHPRRATSGRFPNSQSSIRQASTTSHRIGRTGEHPPSTPTFTPASSTDKNRRKHHTSVTTVYDRS